MKKLGLITFLLIASILLSACAPKAPEPATYTIEMSEYAFTPDTIEAKVGQKVTLELVNNGTLEHEIMFGRDMMMMDNRPNGYQSDMFQMANVDPQVTQEGMGAMTMSQHSSSNPGSMMVLLKPGDKATMTFTATKDMQGEWEFGCFSQEGVHYAAGMVGKFVVKP